MQGISVGEVMTTDLRPIRSKHTIDDLEILLETTNLSGLPVLETNDDLVGVVTTKDLRVAREAELPGNTEVSRIATIGDLLATHINEPMWQAIFRMSTHDISLLPVVAEDDPKKLVGMIYRQDVIKAYDQAITKKANMQHDVEIIKLGKLDEAKFLHLNIPTNSFVIGKRVNEIKLPGHCVIVSLRRGRKLKIVDGQTILRKGDSLTIFSEEECADQIEKILTGQTKLMDDAESLRSFHEEILIKAGSKAIGKLIKELKLLGDILIVSILRNQETIIPHGETVIRLDDIVEVYGKQADIETTRTLFEPD